MKYKYDDFTLYMYPIRKVIMYNSHLDTQPGDLGPFKGCYSVPSTERSFSPRSKKTKEAWNIKTSFKRRQWHLLVWIDWNQSRNDGKSGTNSLTKSQTSADDRSADESHIFKNVTSVTSYVYQSCHTAKHWAVSLVESNQTSQSQRVYNLNLRLWICNLLVRVEA